MKKIILLLVAILGLFQMQAQDLLTIIEIQGEQEQSPYENETVTFNAKVSVSYGDFWYMADAYGAWNGILVIEDDLLVPSNPPWWDEPRQPEVGDELTLTGTVVEVDGNTQIVDVTLVEQTEFWLATFLGVQMMSTATQDESYEGVSVRLMNMTVTSTANRDDEWTASDFNGEVIIIGIDDEATPTVGDIYNVYGQMREFNGVYKVQLSDIDVVYLGINDVEEVELNIFPKPMINTSEVNCNQTVISFELIDMAGKTVRTEEVNNHSFILHKNELEAGTYLLKMNFNNTIYTETISIQ